MIWAAHNKSLSSALDFTPRRAVIDDFARLIPAQLRQRSGSVFYSGRSAFAGPASLYLLGINPGGCPNAQADETVAWHTNKVLNEEPNDWSAYRDESWRNALPGTSGMQPRVLHLLRRVGLEAGRVPASNIVFLRSNRESTLEGSLEDLADLCWPFHEAVIARLRPRAILCFGRSTGEYVRRRLRAERMANRFIERNNRRWQSVTYRGADSPAVIVAMHPSIANWASPNTDPSTLVIEALTQ